MLCGLTKLLKVGRVTCALGATRDRAAWKVITPKLKSRALD